MATGREGKNRININLCAKIHVLLFFIYIIDQPLNCLIPSDIHAFSP